MQLTSKIMKNLADKYGDAFYFLDSKQFRINIDELMDAFRAVYPKVNIAYSHKTNYIPVLARIVNECGGYAEVVSDMETEIALRIGVPTEKIIMNGSCKNISTSEKLLLGGGLM